MNHRSAIVSTCKREDGEGVMSTSPTEGMGIGDTSGGSTDVMDAQSELNVMLGAYQRWTEGQRRQDGQWRRVIEMLRARVNEEAQADKGRQGSEEVNVEVAKVAADSERQRVVQGPDHDRGEMDEDLRWKLRSIGEYKIDDKFLNTHAQIWMGVCPICRIRREEGRSHDWRACPENPEDVAAVQAVH